MSTLNDSSGLSRDHFLTDPLPVSPLPLLAAWFTEAAELPHITNPLAMCLATVNTAGEAANRMVLCKALDTDTGYVVFFTHYHSGKGRELTARPQAAATFYWDRLGRQVRLEGPVAPSPAQESDDYFATRARASQLAARASAQSQAIASKQALLERLAEQEAAYPHPHEPVPRPDDWGGYRLYLRSIELWASGAGRVHDRGFWRRDLYPAGAGYRGGDWSVCRLQP